MDAYSSHAAGSFDDILTEQKMKESAGLGFCSPSLLSADGETDPCTRPFLIQTK